MGRAAAHDYYHTMVFGGLTIPPLQQEEGLGRLFYSGKELGRVIEGNETNNLVHDTWFTSRR